MRSTGSRQLALAKDVQSDPIKPVIEHVDLVVVRRGEKVTVDVPVTIEGEAAAERVVTVDSQMVQLEVLATSISVNGVVSIEGPPPETQVLVSQLSPPEGASLVTDGEVLIVNVTQRISAEALEAELAEAEAGIEHEAPESEPKDAACMDGDPGEGASADRVSEGSKASDES